MIGSVDREDSTVIYYRDRATAESAYRSFYGREYADGHPPHAKQSKKEGWVGCWCIVYPK